MVLPLGCVMIIGLLFDKRKSNATSNKFHVLKNTFQYFCALLHDWMVPFVLHILWSSYRWCFFLFASPISFCSRSNNRGLKTPLYASPISLLILMFVMGIYGFGVTKHSSPSEGLTICAKILSPVKMRLTPACNKRNDDALIAVKRVICYRTRRKWQKVICFLWAALNITPFYLKHDT